MVFIVSGSVCLKLEAPILGTINSTDRRPTESTELLFDHQSFKFPFPSIHHEGRRCSCFHRFHCCGFCPSHIWRSLYVMFVVLFAMELSLRNAIYAAYP